MNKLIAVMLAAAVTTGAAAQTTPSSSPMKDKQAEVRSVTHSNTIGYSQKTATQQEANVKASKEVAKMTTVEKKAFAMELNKQMINPENTGGVMGTAAMQKSNTAVSKAQPKERVNLKTPESQQALQKAATQ